MGAFLTWRREGHRDRLALGKRHVLVQHNDAIFDMTAHYHDTPPATSYPHRCVQTILSSLAAFATSICDNHSQPANRRIAMTRRATALAIALWCILASVCTAQDTPKLRVYYTGHSFHMFVPARVALSAKAAGVKEYELAGTQGIGGSRVIQHWDKDKGENVARKALEKGGVDVFTMSPHLKLPDEGIDHFVGLGLKHNPKMRFLVQQSWMPFDFPDKR